MAQAGRVGERERVEREGGVGERGTRRGLRELYQNDNQTDMERQGEVK